MKTLVHGEQWQQIYANWKLINGIANHQIRTTQEEIVTLKVQ